MNAAKKSGRSKEEKAGIKPLASAALRHPLRVRILEVVNERDISPSQFMVQKHAPDVEISPKSLSQLSYHFRELARYGCLEVVDRVPRRGATENVYRGTVRAYFTDDEWNELTHQERCLISRTVYQGLAARAESAMLTHTFDSRTDRHLSWTAMEVDERGWSELMTTLAGTFGDVVKIRHDTVDRVAGSRKKLIPVTVGLLGFESPPPPRGADEDG